MRRLALTLLAASLLSFLGTANAITLRLDAISPDPDSQFGFDVIFDDTGATFTASRHGWLKFVEHEKPGRVCRALSHVPALHRLTRADCGRAWLMPSIESDLSLH